MTECVVDLKTMRVVRPVIRCELCRWYGQRSRQCRYRPIEAFTVHPDHWCAWGELRKEAQRRNADG